jgi:hypothetical protein
MPNPFNQGDHEDAMRDKLPTIDPERGRWTSASNAHADSLCPARHLRSLGLPDVAGPDAERGTRIHKALEQLDPAGLSPDEFDDYTQLLDMAQSVEMKWVDGAHLIKTEQRLWITFDNGLQHSGKADKVCVSLGGCRALIEDFKSGRGDVTESPRNLQLRDLACLVAVNYKTTEVTVAILQPYQKPLLCTYQPTDIVQALAEMESRVIASNRPNAAAVPGDVQCKWCKAKATCPEFLAACTLPVPVEQMTAAIASLDGPRLGKFLGMARLAKDVAEEEVRSRLGKGVAVPGWRIGEPGERETVTDPQTVHGRFCDLGGTTGAFLGCITVAKGKLKTALKTVTEAKGKALDEKMTDLLAGCVEVKPTAAKLERE